MLERPWALARKLKDQLFRADAGVLIALSTLLVAGFVLLKTIDEVVEGETQWVDRHIVEWIGRHPAPQWFEEFMRDCTAFGGTYVLLLVTVAVGGFLFIRGERRALAFLMMAVVGAIVLSLALKGIFHRDRPQILEHRSYTVTTSFPSGHSMLSAAVWLTLGVMLARLERSRYLKAYFIGVAIFISFLTGVSRVFLGVHWPSDVLAGWMAGTVWAMVCLFVMRYFQRCGHIEPPTDRGREPHPS